MPKRPPYNDRAANEWEDWVRDRFRHNLTNSDMHFLSGLRYIERKKASFTEVVVANVPQWEDASAMSDKPIKDSRDHCVSLGLIDCVPGQPLVKGAGTQVRRRTITEIETGVSNVELRNHTPVTAQEVVDRLRGRTFKYGGGEVTPQIKAGKTGRIYLSKPCPQIEPEDVRERRILSGLKPGEYLIEVDLKQAEPTVAREILTREGLAPDNWPIDIYQNLASYLGQKRDDVKGLVIPFMNANSSVAHAVVWGIRRDHFFFKLAEALDQYKEDLWIKTKPRKRERRHVYTLGRTQIEAFRNERAHRGRLFMWQNQGSVADIMNTAMIEILHREDTEGWRLLFPIHDSVYVVTRNPRHEQELGEIFRRKAEELSIPMQIETTAIKHEDNGKGVVDLRQKPPFSLSEIYDREAETAAPYEAAQQGAT